MCYVCYVGPDCASLYQCVIYEFLEMLPNIIIHRSRNRNKKLSKRKVKRNNFWEREGLDFPSVTVFIFSRIAQWCWSSLPTTIMIFPNLNISKKLLRTSDRSWGEKTISFLCKRILMIKVMRRENSQQCDRDNTYSLVKPMLMRMTQYDNSLMVAWPIGSAWRDMCQEWPELPE